MDIADVTIHVDETVDHDARVQIVENLKACDGVTDVISGDAKPHVMIVKFNPAAITSKELLKSVLDSGVHAQLIGL
ncbi:MAG: hypothetical protein OEZ19_00385 [Paracoccaceae bacterium]|nr:hypothetical protein [Paracoccaceae bacterium]